MLTFTILRVERRVEKMEHAIGEMGGLLILKSYIKISRCRLRYYLDQPPGSIITKIDSVLTKMEIIGGPF